MPGSTVACQYALSDLWKADVDPGQISQVIQNLVINARQAMPEGGTITISGENCINNGDDRLLPGKKYLKLTITDMGGGIPKKYLDKIFDPYFTTQQAGSGLGLAICYAIIRKHDGLLTVQSEMGRGTTFTIYLPAVEKNDVQVEPVQNAATRAVGPAVRLQNHPATLSGYL